MSLILLGILNSQVTGGAAGAYDLLETQVLSSSAASVTFTGLGSYSDYKHLQIRAVAATNRADSFDELKINLNSDASSNYRAHRLRRFSTSVASDSLAISAVWAGYLNALLGSYGPNGFGASVIDILDFSNTSKNTTIRTLNGSIMNGGEESVNLSSTLWINTSAITTIALASRYGASFIAGSRFSLYGVK